MTNIKKGHLLAFFTIIIWGTTFITSKYLLKFLTPSQIMLIRFGIAYIALLISKPSIKKISFKNEIYCMLMGLIGCTLYFYGENTALTYTYASNVSIIVATAPIITAIFAHFVTRDEKLNKMIFVGFFIAILGVILVVLNGTFILKLNPLGDLLSFFAAISWAIYCVLQKKLSGKFDSITLTRKVMFYGFLTSLPFVLAEKSTWNFEMLFTFKSIMAFAFLGILASGICYVLWNKAINIIGVIKTNNYIYVVPFVTIVSARIFLNEKITIMSIIGAFLIIFGIASSQKAK